MPAYSINGQIIGGVLDLPSMDKSDWDNLPIKPPFSIWNDVDYHKEPTDNCVYVVADGVKTYATLLNELYALADKDRIGRNSILVWNESNQNFMYSAGQNAPNTGATYFERATVNGSNWQIISIRLQGASKVYMNVSGSIFDVSSNVATSGITISLYYNIVASGHGMETLAQDVSYGNSNVKAALDALDATLGGRIQLTSSPKTGMANGWYVVLDLSVAWATDTSLWIQVASGTHVYVYTQSTVVTLA